MGPTIISVLYQEVECMSQFSLIQYIIEALTDTANTTNTCRFSNLCLHYTIIEALTDTANTTNTCRFSNLCLHYTIIEALTDTANTTNTCRFSNLCLIQLSKYHKPIVTES